MGLLEILDKEEIQLPIKPHEEKQYFPSYVKNVILNYIDLLERFMVNEEVIKNISEFNDKISELLANYYSGSHHNAFINFKEAMEIIAPDFNDLVIEIEEDEDEFFRARVSNDSEKEFNINEMFHIPFELRNKVRTQRYSFPGLPCLYLGASPYVCWVELKKPSLETFNVARIKKKEGKILKVFDLSRTPENLKNINNLEDKQIVDYLSVWPIIALCSFCVYDKEGFFKPEYIIPQMFLQWLKENDIFRKHYDVQGIKFFTVTESNAVAIKQLRLNYPRMYANYAFPVKENKSEGLCNELLDYFEVTSSISGKTQQFLIPQRSAGIFKGSGPPKDKFEDSEQIVLPDGRLTLYSQSSFFWFENILREPSNINAVDGDVYIQYNNN